MDLSNLQPAEGSRQNDNFRRGRGHGSGNGKTAGKGHKGQNPRDGVKILGNGEVTKKLTVKANAFSESAKAKIEAAGGTVEVI